MVCVFRVVRVIREEHSGNPTLLVSKSHSEICFGGKHVCQLDTPLTYSLLQRAVLLFLKIYLLEVELQKELSVERKLERERRKIFLPLSYTPNGWYNRVWVRLKQRARIQETGTSFWSPVLFGTPLMWVVFHCFLRWMCREIDWTYSIQERNWCLYWMLASQAMWQCQP